MQNNKGSDIYLQLLEDLIGEKINPETQILQNDAEKDNADKNDKTINQALKDSCAEFKNNLGIGDMCVGSPPRNEKGYVEPCPVQYTGNTSDGKIFHCIFIGLNPHLEPWRIFPEKTTFADLANYHHPNDIQNLEDGLSPQQRIKYENRFGPQGDIKNNYWRVMGNMEPEYGEPWSDYYKFVSRIHLALLPDKAAEFYNNFKEDMQIIPNLTEKLLRKFAQYPIANFELVPYKSTDFNIKKFNNIFDKNNNERFAIKYRKYFSDIIDFINKHATDNAFIIATASVKGNSPMIDALYTILKQHMTYSAGDKEHDFRVFNKTNKRLEIGEKEPLNMAPMYLFKWNKRKVIVTSPISSNNTLYKWIYTNLSSGWVDAIRNN